MARQSTAVISMILHTMISGLQSAQADSLTEFAEKLRTKAEYLVMNLPPRPGAWPGAIFTYDMRLPIIRGRGDDPALARGEPTNIQSTSSIDLSGGARGGWGALFSIAAEAKDIATIVMSFENTRVVDMEEDELEKRVSQSSVAKMAATQGRIPQVIVRSYEGIPTLTLIKHASAAGQAWAKLQGSPLDASLNLSVSNEDRLVYRTSTSVVFAFEVMQATFITSIK